MERVSQEEMIEAVRAAVDQGNEGPPQDLKFRIVCIEVAEVVRAAREARIPHQMQVGENIAPELK